MNEPFEAKIKAFILLPNSRTVLLKISPLWILYADFHQKPLKSAKNQLNHLSIPVIHPQKHLQTPHSSSFSWSAKRKTFKINVDEMNETFRLRIVYFLRLLRLIRDWLGSAICEHRRSLVLLLRSLNLLHFSSLPRPWRENFKIQFIYSLRKRHLVLVHFLPFFFFVCNIIEKLFNALIECVWPKAVRTTIYLVPLMPPRVPYVSRPLVVGPTDSMW